LKYFFLQILNSSEPTTTVVKRLPTMSSIMISDVMERHILSFCSEYVGVVVRKLATKYNFDAEEAISELELPTMKRSDVAPRRKEAAEKPKKELRVVPTIPLPFCGAMNDDWCHAIAKNNKLFTQCTNKKEENDLCKKCTKSGAPFGFMETRMACAPMDFKDSMGVSPVHYAIVMKKLNITRETAEAEASKFGWTIEESQYLVPEKAKARGRPKKSDDENSDDAEKKAGKRGRPKKDKPVKASSQMCDDVIANLLEEANKEAVAEANKSSEEEEDASSSQQDEDDSQKTQTQEEITIAPKTKKVVKKKVVMDKEAAKAAKEAEKEAAKAVKEAEKEAVKAAKEAAKEAEKEAVKAAKEAAKAALAAAKEAERANKSKSTNTNEKTKPATKKVEIKQVVEPVVETKELEEEEVDEEEEVQQTFTVKKFEIDGKKYKLSSSDNILFDWNNDEPVGVWNPKTKKIDALPEDDDEEEEDDE